MANLGKVHVGDLNTDIILTVQDTVSGVNQAFDFNANPADTLQILIYDPDENLEDTLAAILVNAPGTDGKIHKVNTDAGLFDQAGIWAMKAKLTLSDGSIYSTNRVKFEVLE